MENFLDRGYRMRAAQTEAEKRENIRDPVSDEEMELGDYDRSLSDIMRDGEAKDKFLNRYIFDKDPDTAKGIVDTLADNVSLTPDQLTFLEKAREGFNLRSAETEKVRELLDQEMGRMAELDPRIREVVGAIGVDKATEILGKQFEDLAFSDTTEFKKTLRNLVAMQNIRGSDEAKLLNKEIELTLRDHGISEKDYFEATKAGLGSVETRAKLDELVASSFGPARKFIDWLTKGKLSFEGGQELYDQLADQEKLMQECDKHLKAIGKVLQGTLTPEVRLAIQRSVFEGGSVEEKKPKDTITTIEDYRKVKEEFASRQNRFEDFVNAEAKKSGKDSSDAAFRDGMRETFAEQEYDRRKRYRARGPIAALLALLFGTLAKSKKEAVDDIKNSLK